MRRVTALSGRDVMTCVMLARTVVALQKEQRTEQAQGFLAMVWNQWREKELQDDGFPADSVGQFFDFYFQTGGVLKGHRRDDPEDD